MASVLSRRTVILSGMAALSHQMVKASDGSRPIRLIVPTPAASASDALARAMTAPWSRVSGRAIVVENIAGAGTTIGTYQIVRAAKDGLTLGIISANHTINPWLYKKLPYDALTDITPITMIGSVPGMLVASNGVAASTPLELVRIAKSAKTPLAEGVVSGTSYQMASEVFKDLAGMSANRIPYKGSAQIVTDLLGGTLDFAVVAAQAAAPHVAAGKLRGLAVTTTVRAEMAPQVPSLVESGFPKFRVDVWLAIVGPPGMSPNDVAARRAEIAIVLADPEMKKALQNQAVQPLNMEASDILPFLKNDLDRNRNVIQKVGITLE